MPLCGAPTRDGAPCRAQALAGRQRCAFHDRSTADRVQEGRSRGGRSGRAAVAVLPDGEADYELLTVADAVRALGKLVNATAKGKLDVRVANSCIYGLATLVKALSDGDIEQRLRKLEDERRRAEQ